MNEKYNKIMKMIKDHPYIIIAILGLISYFQVVTFGYVNFDDDMQIKSNMENLGDIDNLGEAFLTDSFFTKGGYYYRPLMNATFLLDTQVSGDSPWMHHTTALMLHILSALALFSLLQYLKYGKIPSLFWASVFAVSPFFSNAVAWLPARNDLLMGLFALLSFLYYLKFLDKGKVLYYILHIICIMAAFMSKEIAFLLTIAFVFHTFLFKKKELFSKKSFAIYAGWVLLFLLWLYLRSFSHTDGSTRFDPMGINQFLINLPFIPELIAKFFFPFFVTVMPTYSAHITIIGILIIAGIIYYAIKSKDRRLKYVLFGAVFFLLFAAPGMIFRYPTAKDYFEYFEARSYLPMMGFILLCIELVPRSFYDLRKNISKAAIAVILIALIAINNWKIQNYDDPLSFWKAAVIHNPDRALFNFHLGRNLLKSGKDDLAKRFYLRALKLNPNIPEANYETGLLYFKDQQYAKSVPYFEKVIAKEDKYLRVIELQYFVKNSYNSLAAAMFYLGNHSKSIEYYNKYLRKWPNDKNVIENLIKVYINADMFEHAADLGRHYVKIGGNPIAHAEIYNQWAKELYTRKEYESSLKIINRALQIAPDNSIMLTNKGRMLSKLGDHEQAEKVWKAVIKNDPNFLQAYKLLEKHYRNIENNKAKADQMAKKINELSKK